MHTIETERLLLEPLDPSRIEDFVVLTAQPDTMQALVALELESIAAVHHPENVASGRIMEKHGMAYERDVVDRHGWPCRLYRLTRGQWMATR